jgi:MFS family permease
VSLEESEETPHALAPRLPRAIRALRHPVFRVVWVSYLVSQAGFWVSTIALQWLVVQQSGGNALDQGLLYFFNFVPILLFSPLAGVLADRYDRRSVAVACQTGLGLTAMVAALIVSAGAASLPLVYALAFALGVAIALGGPVGQAIVGNSVPAKDIRSAIAIQSVGINLARVAGPALAVPILLNWGPAPAIGVYAVAALATALALSRIQLAEGLPRETGTGWFTQLGDGLRYARRRRPVLALLSLTAVSSVFASSYVALLPVFAYDVLHQDAGGFSALVVATGSGAMLGALATGFGESSASVGRSVLLMLGLCLALYLFALSSEIWLSVVLAALVGAVNFGLMTTLNATLQYIVDDRNRGRVISLYLLCWGGLIPIGGLFMGIGAHLVSAPVAVAVFTTVAALYAGALGLRYRTWRMEQP